MSTLKLTLLATSAAALLAVYAHLTPASAQGQNVSVIPAEALIGTEFAAPEYVRSEHGMFYAPFDGRHTLYTWAEVKRKIEMSKAATAAANPALRWVGQPVSAEALRGSEFDAPGFVRQSWGMLYAPSEGRQVSYPWSEVQQKLNRAMANNRKPNPVLRWSGKPVPVEVIRGTEFDAPGFVRQSWGMLYAAPEDKQISYPWAEVHQVLHGQSASMQATYGEETITNQY